MKKESFKKLLTDLYNAYNKEFVKYIPELTEKYHGIEYSAIEMIMLKYNHHTSDHYIEEMSTIDYIQNLLKQYSLGNYMLETFSVNSNLQKKLDNIKDREIDDAIKKKQDDDDKALQLSNQIEEIKKLKENLLKENKTTSAFDDVDIIIIPNFDDSKIKYPDKKIMASLGNGARIVCLDNEDKPVGLIIEDILCDMMSHPLGNPIIEIVVNIS